MLLHSEQVIKLIIKSRFIAALFVSLCIVGCNRSTHVIVEYESSEWREGDLVFRCGYGMESRAVVSGGQSTYSHVGLLHFDSTHSCWQVVHAVPAEDEPEYLKAEDISLFFSPERACMGAWARVNCSDQVAKEAVQYALRKVEQCCLFDNDYKLSDSTKIYCTELVWRAFGAQGIDVSGAQRQAVPTIFSRDGECIFPIHIEQSETTLFVKPFKTKVL